MELTESSRRIAHVAGVRHLSGLPPASARMHCIQSALSEGSNDGRRNGGGGGHAGSVSRASRLTAADAPAARPFWLLRLPTRLGGRTSCSQTALPPPPPPCVRASPPTGLGRSKTTASTAFGHELWISDGEQDRASLLQCLLSTCAGVEYKVEQIERETAFPRSLTYRRVEVGSTWTFAPCTEFEQY